MHSVIWSLANQHQLLEDQTDLVPYQRGINLAQGRDKVTFPSIPFHFNAFDVLPAPKYLLYISYSVLGDSILVIVHKSIVNYLRQYHQECSAGLIKLFCFS
jgi:hypothetical protein